MIDDEERRRRDADCARRRRKKRREAVHGVRPSTGDSVDNVVFLPPNSSMLDAHIRRVDRYLELLEFDPSISVETKVRCFIAALPALAKGIEAVELRGRLEDLEERLRDRERGNRWGS